MSYYDDSSGYDSALGYDASLGDGDVLGATRRFAARALPGRSQPAAMRPAAAAQAQDARRKFLPVDSGATAIAALGTQTIQVTPSERFRIERFLMDPSVASQFIITEFKIGTRSQLAGAGSLSAASLVSSQGGVGLLLDVAELSQPIVITVQNLSNAAARFMLTLIGTVDA